MPSRFTRRVVPERLPHSDMSLAAMLVFFGLAPLVIVAGFAAVGILSLAFH
ncbi:MAG TPA: hypothetical protein VGU69_02955 [Rhizomicrobium sp.]|nr:hypothetical protein [Rhizomicrobium sp.]